MVVGWLGLLLLGREDRVEETTVDAATAAAAAATVAAVEGVTEDAASIPPGIIRMSLMFMLRL